MELPIGKVIYKLRKEKGITQENLANAVGVSVAAVSKWESKNSYPDITILPSIARFFNTSIDNLLNYEIEISNEEVMKINAVSKWESKNSYPDITILPSIARFFNTSIDNLLNYEIEISNEEVMKINIECARLFEIDSAENAMKTCEEYIRQYPNNLFLKFRIGSLYMMSLASASSEEEAQMILNKAIELLEQSMNSKEQEIMETSKYTLSSLYTMNEEYDKAEEILLSLPKVTADRDDMLVGLYINQGKYNEAKKILRNLTYKRISNIKMSLDSYISLFMKENNISNAKEILNIQGELLRIFNLEDIYAIGTSLMSVEVYSKEKNIEKTLEHIEKIIDSVNHEHNLEGHLLFDGIELFEGVHSKSYVVANLKRVISEDRYDFIKNDKRYKNIIMKLESLI